LQRRTGRAVNKAVCNVPAAQGTGAGTGPAGMSGAVSPPPLITFPLPACVPPPGRWGDRDVSTASTNTDTVLLSVVLTLTLSGHFTAAGKSSRQPGECAQSSRPLQLQCELFVLNSLQHRRARLHTGLRTARPVTRPRGPSAHQPVLTGSLACSVARQAALPHRPRSISGRVHHAIHAVCRGPSGRRGCGHRPPHQQQRQRLAVPHLEQGL
jgi:hypothetical protein